MKNYRKRMKNVSYCFYCGHFLAIRADLFNHFYYEKRIGALEKAGFNALAMRTRFMAAQSVDRGQVDFEWFRNMITIVSTTIRVYLIKCVLFLKMNLVAR